MHVSAMGLKLLFFFPDLLLNRLTPVFVSNRRSLEKDVILSGYLVPAKVCSQIFFFMF